MTVWTLSAALVSAEKAHEVAPLMERLNHKLKKYGFPAADLQWFSDRPAPLSEPVQLNRSELFPVSALSEIKRDANKRKVESIKIYLREDMPKELIQQRLSAEVSRVLAIAGIPG